MRYGPSLKGALICVRAHVHVCVRVCVLVCVVCGCARAHSRACASVCEREKRARARPCIYVRQMHTRRGWLAVNFAMKMRTRDLAVADIVKQDVPPERRGRYAQAGVGPATTPTIALGEWDFMNKGLQMTHARHMQIYTKEQG
jgi:hypothetical protein